MNHADSAYARLVNEILNFGTLHHNRTGVDTKRIWGAMADIDLTQGFPLLTTKKMATKSAFVELLGFVRGIADVDWYSNQGCRIWEADHARWHGPDLVRDIDRLHALGNSIAAADMEERTRLVESIEFRREFPRSLGRIYGVQWRHHGQLDDIITALKARSESRRLIMSAWNYGDRHLMALPPCHLTYHFVLRKSPRGDFVDVVMHQRSADIALGVPFNWATTALLTHLVGHATGLQPGRMVWFGDDVHAYLPHINDLEEQVARDPHTSPRLVINAPEGALPWEVQPQDLVVEGYNSHPAIKYELFVG
jgi:thymidylate synthase